MKVLSVKQANKLLCDLFDKSAISSMNIAMQPRQKKRNKIVEKITEVYLEQFGCNPPTYVLDMLGNYVLLDYIKEKHHIRNKKDNIILTEVQLAHRRRKETAMDTDVMSHFNAKENFNFPTQRVTQEYSN